MTDTVDPARPIALALLTAVTEDGRLMTEALGDLAGNAAPDVRARAGRLAMETLRWADRADRMLGPFLRLKPTGPLLNLLRLGTVEMCQLGEAPHGVVNDLVGLAGAKGPRGLANAVLRKVARLTGKWATLPVPHLPKALRKRLIAAWGKQAVEAMEAAHAAGAPLDLTVKSDVAGWAARLGGEVMPTGSVRISARAEVTKLDGYDGGDWWVQDAAAAIPARVLDVQPAERVLDLCAAPGGKTMQLAAAGAKVTALDNSDRRMARVRENLARTKLSADIVVADALEFQADAYDAILLDAPCSATGTIRRHPDLPYAKAGEDFAGLVRLQAAMLDRAMDLLKPGGRLVYCTCSLLPEEGEGQISAVLDRRKDVELRPTVAPGIPPEWAVEQGLRVRPDYWPEAGGVDGFFIALLKKREDEKLKP